MNYITAVGSVKLNRMNPETIISIVCKEFRVSYEQLKERSRVANTAYARQVAMYFIRRNFELTLKAIASYFNRHHSTVIHADRTVQNIIEFDRKERERIDKMSKLLKTGYIPSDVPVIADLKYMSIHNRELLIAEL